MEISWEVKAIAILVLVGAIAGSYRYVYDSGIAAQKQIDIVAQTKANNEAKAKYDVIVKELEDEKGKSHVIYQTITKQVKVIVDRPVYSNVCLDTDGLRLFNDALKGTNTGETVK